MKVSQRLGYLFFRTSTMTEKRHASQTAATIGTPQRERAVLISVVRDSQELRQSEEYLDELEFLAETADIEAVKRFTQRLPQPSARIYVGPGKLEEIAAYCEENAIDVAIFDDELTPAQTRNIERALPCRLRSGRRSAPPRNKPGSYRPPRRTWQTTPSDRIPDRCGPPHPPPPLR